MKFPITRIKTINSLEHHGIQGMHWGKRNGPPYPLSYEAHTAEQKRKNKKSLIDGVASGSTKAVKTISGGGGAGGASDEDEEKRRKNAEMAKKLADGIHSEEELEKMLKNPKIPDGLKYIAYRTYQSDRIDKNIKSIASQVLSKSNDIYAKDLYDDKKTYKIDRSKVDAYLNDESDGERTILKTWQKDLDNYYKTGEMVDWTGNKIKGSLSDYFKEQGRYHI